ncbi:MAG: biotin transporter BioY [Bacteroidota bacterium]
MMLIDQFTPSTADKFWDGPVKVLLAGLVMALVAPITLHVVEGIPITLQTLVILLLVVLLGKWRGTAAVGLYLIMGALGLPVFAQGKAGVEHLIGLTSGFLWGFLVAAFVVGMLAERPWARKWWGPWVLFFLGHGVILALGIVVMGLLKEDLDWAALLNMLWRGSLIKSLVGGLLVMLSNMLMQYLLKSEVEEVSDVEKEKAEMMR